MEIESLLIELELRRLSEDYALSADAGDCARFSELFTEDATLRVGQTGTTAFSAELRGRDKIASIPETLRHRFSRTSHFLGQSRFHVNGSEASGVTYCQASHLRSDGEESRVLLMHIHYEDGYRRDGAGVWRIVDRTAWIDWTEEHRAS